MSFSNDFLFNIDIFTSIVIQYKTLFIILIEKVKKCTLDLGLNEFGFNASENCCRGGLGVRVRLEPQA